MAGPVPAIHATGYAKAASRNVWITGTPPGRPARAGRPGAVMTE